MLWGGPTDWVSEPPGPGSRKEGNLDKMPENIAQNFQKLEKILAFFWGSRILESYCAAFRLFGRDKGQFPHEKKYRRTRDVL